MDASTEYHTGTVREFMTAPGFSVIPGLRRLMESRLAGSNELHSYSITRFKRVSRLIFPIELRAKPPCAEPGAGSSKPDNENSQAGMSSRGKKEAGERGIRRFARLAI